MSTVAELVEGSSFSEAIASVRSDSTEDRYVLLGHVDSNPNVVDLVASGNNVEDLIGALDDSQVMYALVRYESEYDMSKTVKFVYFHWSGENVPFAKRGRFGVVHGSVEALFQPYHLMVETSSREDFDTSKIIKQLEENTGKVSKVLEPSSLEGRQERGFTQNQLPVRQAKERSGPTASREGAKVEFSEEVLQDIGKVRADVVSTRWMLCQYRDGDPKQPVDSYAVGDGDINELLDQLEDRAMYGLYRVTDTVDDITTVKFVFIQWVPGSLKPMAKAKISTHKGTTEAIFAPYHVSIFATDKDDLSENIVMEKVTSASGTKSHVK